MSLLNRQSTISDLQQSLGKQQIQLLLRQNDKDVIYGLTYIDHYTKCVFNGSDLGKQYSANVIQQRCQHPSLLQQENFPCQQRINHQINSERSLPNDSLTGILHHLTESTDQSIAFELKEETKRKRKKQKHQ